MLHPESTIKSMKDMPAHMGLNDTSVHIPTIDPFPSKFFNALIWDQVGRLGIDFVVGYTCDWDALVTDPLIDYADHGCKAISYCCSSDIDARDKVKGGIQKILRNGNIPGDVVLLTGSDGIMMKSWLVNFFAGKTSSDNCNIVVVVGTSAVNCGISSSTLYYIFVKGFLQSINELVQLMGRLKRGKGERVKQDCIHPMLSLLLFSTIYFTILSEIGEGERARQLQEIMTVVKVIMCRNKCIRQSIEEYYGSAVPNPPLTCAKLCPSCRFESPKVIKRNVLIDHLEVDVFDTGSVTLGLFAAKLMAKKGAI